MLLMRLTGCLRSTYWAPLRYIYKKYKKYWHLYRWLCCLDYANLALLYRHVGHVQCGILNVYMSIILFMILFLNHEWRTDLSEQTFKYSKRCIFCEKVGSLPQAIFLMLHMRGLCNIPWTFLYYECQHCTLRWGCIYKMIYSVRHHPCWTLGDGKW